MAIAAAISMATALASLPLVVSAGNGVWNGRSATEFLMRTLEVLLQMRRSDGHVESELEVGW